MSAPLFLHGLESSPQGNKAIWLRDNFGASTPALDTRDFSVSVQQARDAIARLAPNVVIGSSFGGAVLLELLSRGDWRGPCVFLAQAGVKLTPHRALPDGTRAYLIHGLRDDVIPIEDSRLLASTGGPDVHLIEVDDDHRLGSVLGPVLEDVLRNLMRPR